MQIRVTIKPDGSVTILTVSIIEDLWQDYCWFKERAYYDEEKDNVTKEYFIAKRYQRAAPFTLCHYFEGVVNNWLQGLCDNLEFQKIEEKSIYYKYCRVMKLCDIKENKINIQNAKKFRNMFVHYKRRTDLKLIENVNYKLIEGTEKEINRWLDYIEQETNLRRHGNAEEASRKFSETIGGTLLEETGSTIK
ncbi:hypothetical protein [Propionispora hippei]|uniref:Uncharacterized protein n=1 Tax=Propionispora hippei DSM 15287 TaxID=1123003 RepID=A0A1M6GZ06_9FIRM|nr:hypothetical protein [Propionispora hippei]SHJ15163.1 hypothetical protein SAMN02745170_01827 [Propionispora hippei DSM 15287]